MKTLYEPWPWYVAGPVLGIIVPILLLVGNKRLGISSTLRHICAACLPSSSVPLFRYDWRKESWSLYFAGGILVGGFVGGYLFANPAQPDIAPDTVALLQSMGAEPLSGGLLPEQIFNWQTLFTLKGFLMIVVGGFLVGFGTRYAQGCTSGHGIFGLATLQWPSLIATACFFAGGIIFSYLVLPWILNL